MKILLTNDDGFEAPGIVQLYESLKDKYEVFFLAPKENMSGKGSAITVWDQPSFQNHGNGIHSLNGTPVDCVKYAINFYCPFTPDLVVSGINPGPNLGTDILFSGTVGAALEGRNLKYPSIALSANSFELNIKKVLDFKDKTAFVAYNNTTGNFDIKKLEIYTQSGNLIKNLKYQFLKI